MQARRVVTATLTSLSLVADVAIIIVAAYWSGLMALAGVIGVLSQGVSGEPGTVWIVFAWALGMFFPAIPAAAMIWAHVARLSWRWRWQVVTLIAFLITYSSVGLTMLELSIAGIGSAN